MNERQRRFLNSYAKDPNGQKAALAAGYPATTARSNARHLRRKPEIAAALERREAARERRLTVTADRVLEEFARIAFADIRNYATWGPEGVRLRPAEEIEEPESAAIAELSANGKAPRIRLHDKKAALHALARHLGLFEARAPADDATIGPEDTGRLRERLMARIAELAAAPETPHNGNANGDDR